MEVLPAEAFMIITEKEGLMLSISDFWSNKVQKCLSFGTAMANSISVYFVKKNCMSVFMPTKSCNYLAAEKVDMKIL